MPERETVTCPPEDEPGHRGQCERGGRRLVHNSLRAPRRATVGPPIVLDVMKSEHGEDERYNRVKKGTALVREKGHGEPGDKENIGHQTLRPATHPRDTITSGPPSRGRPTEAFNEAPSQSSVGEFCITINRHFLAGSWSKEARRGSFGPAVLLAVTTPVCDRLDSSGIE